MTKKATVSRVQKPIAQAYPACAKANPIMAPGFRIDPKSLLAALTVAGLLRLIWLGRPAFRADTIHFWSMAQQGLSFGDVWSR